MRRTAVTGIGVVAPGGVTRDKFWATLVAGRTATRKITFFDASGFRSQIAAECDFDPREAGLDEQEICRTDRYIQFALAAALEAMKDSRLDDIGYRARRFLAYRHGLGRVAAPEYIEYPLQEILCPDP